MAEFVFGLHAAKKTDYVLKSMKDALKCGKKVILIVPEQQALAWDTITAERLSPTDAFNVETVSFTRLADSVFRRYGGTAKKYITDSEKTLLMWNAIFACSDKMKSFKSLDREDRYAPLFLKTVNELKMYSVFPHDLEEAANELAENDTLAERLRDLAQIYAVYDIILHDSFCDPAEIPDALCDVLSENNYFENTRIYIDSFFTLTPKEIKIVEHILQLTDDVTVTFAASAPKKEETNPDNDFVDEYFRKMASLCNKCNRQVNTVIIPSEKTEEIEYLQKNLWNYTAPPFEKKTDKITVIKCTDRYNEANLAAAQIKKLVANGAKYSEIAVVAADVDALRGITDTEIQNHNIPLYVAGKTPLTAQPAFKLLRAAAGVVSGGWKKESLCAFLKTGLCNITPDMCDAFEKYTEIWNINGKDMYTGNPWDMNPDGYTEHKSIWGNELLRQANEVKKSIVPSLSEFGKSFSGTLRDVCAAAYKLLCDFGVYSQLCKKAKAQCDRGDFAAAQETSQVWDAICTLLDTLATVVPDARTDAFRFSSLLTKVASACSIGTIPDGIDRVVFGSVTGMRLDGFRHLIVLGAIPGVFPRTPTANGFFSDKDKISLSKVGINISPTTDKKIAEELFRFRYTVCSPEDTLTILIPSGNGECRPSVGAAAVMRLFPADIAQHFDFSTQKGIKAAEDYAGCGRDISNTPLCADGDSISPETALKIFTNHLTMSQTRLESFNGCPFSYYGKYVLNLDGGKTAEINSADIGTFVHAVLENFVRDAADENIFPVPDDVLVSRSERLVNSYLASVCPNTLSSRRDWIFRRVKRSINLYAESISNEFGQSEFRPYEFELSVGYDDNELPSKLIPLSNDAVMSFRGKVDRVDILRKNGNVYLRVVDYKTGSKDFSKAKIAEGKNVQLLLYLFSLCASPDNCNFHKKAAPNGEKILPAGALYFDANLGNTKSNEPINGDEAVSTALRSISRKGIVLNDSSVIQAMDRDFSGVYAPVTLDKDGKFTKASSVETAEGFEQLEDDMDSALKKIGDRIYEGCAASTPETEGLNGPCQYCDMKPFCRHNG